LIKAMRTDATTGTYRRCQSHICSTDKEPACRGFFSFINHAMQWSKAMTNTIVRVFSTFSDAQHARDALLASGFVDSNVHLSSQKDEAGPPEGNFVLDEKDTGTNYRGSFLNRMLDREPRTDALRVPPHAKERGTFLLVVDADDDDQQTCACDIMNRFNAIDVDKRTCK
jgi:hypothetical protein